MHMRTDLLLTKTPEHSGFGHDKSLEIRPYAAIPNRPIMFYAGDGVSDLSAAKETDLLFAKAGRGKSFFSFFCSFFGLLRARDMHGWAFRKRGVYY